MNKLLAIPPPVYGLISLGLCKAIDGIFDWPLDISSPAVGTLVALAGLAILVWAWLGFCRQKTTPIPTGEPSALVAEGPYRLSRNPMYIGLLILLASVAFFTGSPIYLLSPIGVFFIIDRLFIPYEEAKLERLFGEDFIALKSQVRRWL